MNIQAFDSLSPRERECLRLIAQGHESKQIAALLSVVGADGQQRPLTANTVDGYVRTAMAKLGVTRRKDAARLFAEHEDRPPRWLGDRPSGVESGEEALPRVVVASGTGRMGFPLPWRRRGEVNNELGVATRLLWIPVLAIGLAMGFGMLTSGLKVMVDLIGSSPLLTHTDPKRSQRDQPCYQFRIDPQRGRAAAACEQVRTTSL